MSQETLNHSQDRLLKIDQIIGSSERGYAALVPVSKSTWWAGVSSGRFPKPVKLGEHTTGTFWRLSDIQKLIAEGC